MKTPNFFILGAQKAGTTYLAQVLADHPDIFFTIPKETMFFSRKRERSESDYEAYCEEFFGDASDHLWRGEGSTTYLQWPGALERIRRFVRGRPRFIVSLRHPTAKAISFYIHNWRRDRYPPDWSLAQILDQGVELSPRETSFYGDAIARWLNAFPREDFLFLKFDDLTRSPRDFVRQATDHLGLDPAAEVPDTAMNVGLPLVWDADALTVAQEAPGGRAAPRLALADLEAMHQQFLPDLKRTEALTGLDLSDWYAMPNLAPARV